MAHAVATGEAGVRQKAQPWQMGVGDFYDGVKALRGKVAQLMGCRPLDVAFVPSVSYAMAIAAANLKVPAGGQIVVLAEQFPSNVYPWRGLAQQSGGTVETVARPVDGDWTSAVLAKLDARVAIAALPHCHWADGGMLDLEAIGARCHELGIALVIDATQSLGALPLNLQKVRPAFMVAASYKWLMGAYSFGYLYVDEAFHQGQPLELGWMPRKNSFRFDRLVDYTDELEPGAERFDVGERSNFIAVGINNAVLDQLLTWQVPRISATLEQKTAAIKRQVEPLGFIATPGHAPHLMGLRAPSGLSEQSVQTLKAKQVFVSVRGDAVRVAPHLYNDDADIEKLVDALKQLL